MAAVGLDTPTVDEGLLVALQASLINVNIFWHEKDITHVEY